jgi:benzylsuccinate CoA-transferase BbsE subunit
MPEATGPLNGLLVSDFSTTRAELAGRVLAELGAEVVKVEPPGGASARHLAPFEE